MTLDAATVAGSIWPIFVGFVVVVLWSGRLESRVGKLEGESKEMNTSLKATVEEMRKNMFDLTIEVTKMMAKLEHLNGKVLDLKQEDVRRMLSREGE